MSNKKAFNVLILILFFSFGCKAQESKEIYVILLAGQSNMIGAGNYDELDSSIRERVKKISNRVLISHGNMAQIPLTYFDNKPTEKYNFTKRFGPEIMMGLTLAERYPEKEFLFIKRAVGGTSLYGAWNPELTAEKAKEIEKGEWKQAANLNEIYIKLINDNLEKLDKKGKAYKIMVMTWMQGENDAVLEKAAKSYSENLEKLILKYRTTFNVKEMPFVFGQINSKYGVKNGAKLVREEMEKVPLQVKNTFLIKTSTDESWSDFPKHPDNVHYNTEGQRKLGIAFGEELIKFIEK